MIVLVIVAFWKGSEITVVGCTPPVYPVPAPVILTVPKPFLITVSALVEKVDASDEPNTVLPPNPPIFSEPLVVLPNDIDLSTLKYIASVSYTHLTLPTKA